MCRRDRDRAQSRARRGPCRWLVPAACHHPAGFLSYEEFLRAVAHQAGLAPRLIPIPLTVWHALAGASEMFPSPLLTRNQVELMQIDTVSSLDMPGFVELGISPHSVEAILQKMLSNCG